MQLCSFPSRILSPPLSLLFSKQFFSSKSFFPTEPVFLPLSSAFPLKTRTRMEQMQMNAQSGRLSSTQTQSFSSIYTLKVQFRSLRSLTYPEDAEDATVSQRGGGRARACSHPCCVQQHLPGTVTVSICTHPGTVTVSICAQAPLTQLSAPMGSCKCLIHGDHLPAPP